MIQEQEIYRQMFQALQTGELSELIRRAHEIMGHPLIFTNASYVKLLEVYPDTPSGDEKWDAYLGRSEVDVETIVNVFEHDYIDVMRQTRNAVVMDTGYFEDSPRLTASVFSQETLIGYVSMLCEGEKQDENCARALQIVADTLALHMREFYGEHADQINMRAIFAEKLIGGEIHGKQELIKWFTLTNIHPTPHYIMITIAVKKGGQEKLARYLCSRIQLLNMPILLYHTEDSVCGILYGLTGPKVRNIYFKQLEKLLYEYDFSCDVSRSFTSIEDIPQYRRQSEIALQIGRQYQPSAFLHKYRELTLTAITDSIIMSLGYDNAIHPAVSLLEWVDETRNTAYLETLETNVLSGYSSQETCEKLHIHRNTLNYRLSRIEELAGIDLKNPDTRIHLAISFLMRERRIQ